MIFITFEPLPLKNASFPYELISLIAWITVSFFSEACIIIFTRSKGAVQVLETAPEIAPAMRVTIGEILVSLSY